jgi:hypothetical protein
MSRLGQVLAGESTNPDVAEAMADFKTSLVERAIRNGSGVTAARAEAFLDGFIGVRSAQLKAVAKEAESIEWLVKQTLKETEERVKLELAGDENSLLRDAGAPERPPVARRKGEGDPPVIVVDDKEDIPPPEDFGGLGQLTTEWFISETVHSIYCDEETPGTGSDDIIFQGEWRLNTRKAKLRITSEEIDYDEGDTHFYDSTPQPTPHAGRELLSSDNPLSLYFSTHVLTETDGWTEIAAAIAAALEDAIANPMSTIAPIAGVFAPGVPGVGAAAGLGGAALDALADNLSGDLLSKVGDEVSRYFHDAIAGIGADDNIVFEPWNTMVLIRWIVDPQSGQKTPRWTAQHAVPGRFRRMASPEAENPKNGEGILSPSYFAGMSEVFVAPLNYPRDEYPRITGKYRYMSEIRVDRRQTTI